jgi:hypothetical protein
VPVFVVPGNHERSVLPHARLLAHAGVHVFDRPRTFVLDVRGTTVALTGFPYERRHVRACFPALLELAEWDRQDAAVRLLCCITASKVRRSGRATSRSRPRAT